MSTATVEQVVRAQLAKALGGTRGIIEAAIPTLVFTVSWIIWRDLNLSLITSLSAAVLALILRIVQRQTTQFVFNAAFGIAIAAIFAWRSGDARDAFLPGILYNAAYALVMVASIAVRRPIMGYIVGAASEDFTSWTRDKAMIKLASRLTWLLAIPCVLRVLVQYPLYQAEHVALLGTAKIVMGWPLQIAALLAMAWVLKRDSIPVES